MRKLLIILASVGTTLFVLLALFLATFSIRNTQPEDCTVVDTEIINVIEGSTYDIVFKSPYQDSFYINRGLEQGLNLDSLRNKVLNKTVTLHLAKLPLGTSHHISQLAVGEEVLFTEFDWNGRKET